ncbi:MAG TPA: tetratricopeptide repeat protein [Streptosporangiaceae bacterium]|nr:tetratricopeptide repeat protein [Streptosporangiaceae bacterium]
MGGAGQLPGEVARVGAHGHLAAGTSALRQAGQRTAQQPGRGSPRVAFRPALAMSLNNLSLRLADLGRPEDALTAIDEAVTIRRELAAARPDAFRPGLANSLNNLSARLADLGRPEDALTAIDEATRTYRELAAARPDAFRPALAMSLNNLSNQLAGLGRPEDALTAIDEAVTIRRELAARWPDAYHHELEQSLRAAARLEHGEDLNDASPRRPEQ